MSNTKGGVSVNPLTEWKAFDQLPPPVCRVIAFAPYDYKVSGILQVFKTHVEEGGDVASFRKKLVLEICDDLQKQARETYGADHPDAQYHRLRGHHPHD